jgi:acetyltransferase-like isoleucine patch superfamily enzyme
MAALDLDALGLAAYGDDVTIYDITKITQAGNVRIGSHVIVDDFVFLQGGQRLDIGSYVHIASYVLIAGGGEGLVGNFVSLSAGTKVYTGSDDPTGDGLTNPTVPDELRAVKRLRTEICDHAFLGADTVVLPGVTVGEGAVVGSCGLVTKDVEPWTINVGAPAQPVKERPREKILEFARRLGFPDGS